MQETETSVDEFGIDRHSPLKLKQRGGRKVVLPAVGSSLEKQPKKVTINSPLLHAVARAFYWAKLIDQGIVASGSEIAKKEGLDSSTVNELLRLSLLSPKIVESILNGKQPEGLTMQWPARNSLLADWSKQVFTCAALQRPLVALSQCDFVQ